MYATTQFTPQHETTQRSDTHTHTHMDRAQTAASVCVITAGRWVKGGRCMEDFNSHHRQTSAKENKFVRSLSVFIHVSQLVQSGTARGITGPSSRRHLTSDLHIVTVTVA